MDAFAQLFGNFDVFLGPLLRAGLIVAIGVLMASIVRRRLTLEYLKPTQSLLVTRVSSYLLLFITFAWALSELGLDLRVLLGAAGVLTVAAGFAAQTSASNFISGLLLMAEQPFALGHVIRVGDVTGEVLSVDLLSVKLRTFDNLYVRIPNETLLKSTVTNMSHFPIRRYDLKVGIAYKEDIERARRVLFEVAERNPICLQEPEPLFIFQGYGESSLDLQFSVWASTPNYLKLRNTIHEEVKLAFDAHGIEIPFPHRTLYTGSTTEPFPVRVVRTDDPS